MPNARTVVYALLTVLAMVAIYALGFHVRTVRFDATQMMLDVPFWMESAQRYRYVEILAEGGELPNPDTRMWAPDGYDPRTDTILQEQIYGWTYRALALGPDLPVAAFVRTFTRVVYGLGIFALVALCGVLGRSRVGALLACLAYAVILPAVERSTGQVLYREHLAIPLVVFHLYFLAAALERERVHDALLSGLFLLLALLSWKVMTFYVLLLMGVFALAAVVQPGRPATARTLAWSLAPAVVVSLLLPTHLRFDLFWASTGAVLGGVTWLVLWVHRRQPMGTLSRLTWIGLGTLALTLATPEASAYDHAWETIRARLSHLGHKPADPGELTFHARHFWSGNYRSPTLARLVRDFGLPVVAAVPGVIAAVRHVWIRRRVDAHAALLLLLGALGGAYLVFRKLQSFPAMLVAVFVGLGWTAGRGGARWASRALVVVTVTAMVAQAYGWIPETNRWLGLRGPASRYPVPVTQIYTGGDVGALVHWIETRTGPDDVVLADFVISPFLVQQTDRPVVLNCFFESPMVERYRDYTEALFADEPSFAEFCRKHEVDWVVHSADQLLRVDEEMSYRYVADATDWDPDWPAALLHYHPEALQHFELVHESSFFRVYRVLPEGAEPAEPPPTRSPLFSTALARQHWGDPRADAWPAQGDPAGALYAQVQALTQIDLAARLARPADPEQGGAPLDAERARELTEEAVTISPYEPSGYVMLADLAEVADPEEAEALRALADALERGLAGFDPLPALSTD